MAASRPNILLITTDQHRYDAVGSNGNPVIRTPAIDSLAERGVRFQSAFSPCPLCMPARTSILTSQYVRTHGVVTNDHSPDGGLHEGAVFTRVLRDAGYRTALVGKHHIGHNGRMDWGLDVSVLVEGKYQFMPEGRTDEYRRWLAVEGLNERWISWTSEEYEKNFGAVTSYLDEAHYIDTYIGVRALEFLEAVDREPFFLWASFASPHHPWDPPAPYDAMYEPASMPAPHRALGEMSTKPRGQQLYFQGLIPPQPNAGSLATERVSDDEAYARLPQEVMGPIIAHYYGTITLVDRQIARLLSALDEKGLRENTLVVFTSDHGEYLGDHWMVNKSAALYDCLVHVPLVVDWPGHAPAASTTDQMTSLIDIGPTLLEAAGIGAPSTFQGRSVLEAIEGGGPDERNAAFFEIGGVAGVRTRRHKLVRYADESELYDLEQDPYELANLWDVSEFAEAKAELAERLDAWRDETAVQ